MFDSWSWATALERVGGKVFTRGNRQAIGVDGRGSISNPRGSAKGSGVLEAYTPGVPVPPALPYGTAPKATIFEQWTNANSNKRPTDLPPFELLRRYRKLDDVVKIGINALKARVKSNRWRISARDPERAKDDDVRAQIDERTRFWESPDRIGRRTFDQWIGEIVEDALVIDCVAIANRWNFGGEIHSFEVIDAASLKVLVDGEGRIPEEGIAFQQFDHGAHVRGAYTQEEIFYRSMSPVSYSVYGESAVERCINSIIVALLREERNVGRYTEGNIPPVWIKPPLGSSVETWGEWVKVINEYIVENRAQSLQLHLLPPGAEVEEISPISWETVREEYIWHVRTVYNALGLNPMAWLDMPSRASGEEISDISDAVGHVALLDFLDSIVNQLEEIANPGGLVRFEWVDGLKGIDADQRETLKSLVEEGAISPAEYRAEAGFDQDDRVDALDLKPNRVEGGGLAGLLGGSFPSPDDAAQVETPVDAQTPPESSEAGSGATPTAGPAQEIQVTEDAVLNGAQITAALAIVQQVAAGIIPRDAGLGTLEVAFNLPAEKAAKMLGAAGAGFVPSVPGAESPSPEPTAAPPEDAAMTKAQEAELQQWRRFARERFPDVAKAADFDCQFLSPNARERIRAGIGASSSSDELAQVFKAAREELPKAGRKPEEIVRKTFSRFTSAMETLQKAHVEAILDEYRNGGGE